ncbi:MurR/RpiR family transcriptional regulator [Bacillus safensis]|uniref:MurR/RpiR family transcriptional regulator n=1 Tax=Bacillus safensis TaxID=561879 RepID=UPI00046A4CB2|nr:MurR/RpiR family transcriptional regulator [Bacillus safensis]
MYLIQKIEEITLQFNDSRKSIGEYILKSPDQFLTLSMEEFAKNTYTSKASLVRFAKTLGFSGWKTFVVEMKEALDHERKYTGKVDPNIPFNENDSFKNIAHNLSILQSEAIKDTANNLDGSKLFKANRALREAEHIMIFCISPYLYLAELFRRKMMTIGKQVTVAYPMEAAIGARTLSDKDCAIVISYSGNNELLEPILHLKELKERQVKIIGMTSGGDNMLRDYAYVTLTISSRERLFSKIANYSTEESVNYLFNVLFSCYFQGDYKENLQNKITTSKQIEEKRYTHIKEIQD